MGDILTYSQVGAAVPESVMEEVKVWQGRPLDAIYPMVYLDASSLESCRQRPSQPLPVLPGVGQAGPDLVLQSLYKLPFVECCNRARL